MSTENLKSIGLRPLSEHVLVALSQLGRSPAVDIASFLNKPKSSIYDSLEELKEKSLVIEESGDTGKVFVLADPRQIEQVKERRISDIQSAFAEITKMASEKKERVLVRPRIRFYSGIEGTKQAFRDMGWVSEHKDAYLMWPMKDMLDTLGEEFLKHHGEGRFKHGVLIHSIRKESDRILVALRHDWLKDDIEEKLREVRYASADTEWGMSFWTYGDQTLFAGSGSEHFALIVKSRDFANLMITLWKHAWVQATK
jgi:sugar-specific transcriptional regulator TrmB